MNTQQRSFARRIGAAVAAGACFVGLGATPVAADAPIAFDDSETFTDFNPCTGAEQDITINFAVRLHEHRNNNVVHVSRTGTTSDGYVMSHGSESFVENKNVARGTFTDNWTGPDGSKFKAQGVFVFDIRNDEPRVERFRLRCVRS